MAAKLTKRQRRRHRKIREEQGIRAAKRYRNSILKKSQQSETAPESTRVSELGVRQQARYNRILNTQGQEAADQYLNSKLPTTDTDVSEITTQPGELDSPSAIIDEPTLDNEASSVDIDAYMRRLQETIFPEVTQFASKYGDDIALDFKSLDEFADHYINRDSALYDKRIEREKEDARESAAARGLFNSGFALNQERELVSNIRAEELERALDLARIDQASYNQQVTNNQRLLQQGSEFLSTAVRDQLMFDIERNDTLNQQDIDNLLRATDLFFRQSPLQVGANAAGDISTSIANEGVNTARNTANNYTRVVAPTQPLPSNPGAAPVLDTTQSRIADALARGNELVAKSNNNANTSGNILNQLPGLINSIPGIANAVTSIFGGGGAPATPDIVGSTRT